MKIEININTPDRVRALSIYFGCPIIYNDMLFCSAIQLFTWFKIRSPRFRAHIMSLHDPKSIAFFGTELGLVHLNAKDKVKKLKPIKLRSDWEDKHLYYLRKTLELKFEQNPVCKQILLDSSGKLVETDQNAYWCHPVKKNQYGLMLQKLRTQYQGN